MPSGQVFGGEVKTPPFGVIFKGKYVCRVGKRPYSTRCEASGVPFSSSHLFVLWRNTQAFSLQDCFSNSPFTAPHFLFPISSFLLPDLTMIELTHPKKGDKNERTY